MKRHVLMGIAILMSAVGVQAVDVRSGNAAQSEIPVLTPDAVSTSDLVSSSDLVSATVSTPDAISSSDAVSSSDFVTTTDLAPSSDLVSATVSTPDPVSSSDPSTKSEQIPSSTPIPTTDALTGSITDTLTLQEVTVNAAFSSPKNSPLRLTVIDSETLRSRAAARTYPELLKGIPSVYATAETGSYGDAKFNIRGFGQENIAVLLNGIPISGLTSGNMFWNNWMGLADATYAIQLQKGVGASMLSDGSVGGSMNIITSTSSEQFSASAGMSASHFGTYKGYVSISSGVLSKGWAINLMASYVGGKGYVQATDVSAFSYMLNVSKRIGNEHTLLFTALGSPEQHDQRSQRLSMDEINRYGRDYNKNWGVRDGKPYNISRNNYFKPYFTLQHIWNGERLSMKNSVYLAVGSGGGRWTETKGAPILSFTREGLIDWTAVTQANAGADRSYLPSDAPEGNAAMNILSDFMAGHTQTGAVASAEYALTERWKLGAGLHYQYYSTWENEQITDLLGADFWYEDYAGKSLAGLAGRDPYKKVGDYIRTNNGKVTHHGTFYLTASYQAEKFTANIGLSGFGSVNRRWDRYNYTGSDIWSDTAKGLGASVKGGMLWKPSYGHSIYLNGGWYSRLPYPSVWFSSGNNEITENVRNERNTLGELGYRFTWSRGGVEVTGYAAYWKNRSMMSNPYKQADAIGVTKYMVTGLDALHYGVEVDAFYRPADWVRLSAFASLGDWRWKNDVEAIIYDNYSYNQVGTVGVYSDGLPVGGAPQTQVGASVQFSIPGGFGIDADWQFNDRMYAEFDPVTRTSSDDRAPAYRIPSYHLLGATLRWTGTLSRSQSANRDRCRLTVYITGANLLDTMYIERGKDGASHDLDTFRGYWGFGRNFTFGLRFTL